jgi:hypothetical protein
MPIAVPLKQPEMLPGPDVQRRAKPVIEPAYEHDFGRISYIVKGPVSKSIQLQILF